MVVDIRRRDTISTLFNCRFWSDFHDENERFFLAALTIFEFKSIHNVPTLENYEQFVRIIGILQTMLNGYSWIYGELVDLDVFNLKSLLLLSESGDLEILDSDNFSGNGKVPIYIQQLFRNFTNHQYVLDE